jgi:hypothetical protein
MRFKQFKKSKKKFSKFFRKMISEYDIVLIFALQLYFYEKEVNYRYFQKKYAFWTLLPYCPYIGTDQYPKVWFCHIVLI